MDISLAGSPRPSARWAAVSSAALVVGAAALGQAATTPNLPWYHSLEKPRFNPPDFVFGPVWTALYGLMAYALWRVLRLPTATPGRSLAIGLYVVQLTLNVAWTFAFFGARDPALGLVDIVPQLAFVIATALAFGRLDAAAGYGFVPIALWVGFASVLNLAIWRLN